MLFSGNICLVQEYRVELFAQSEYLVKNNKKERFSNKSVTQGDNEKLKIFICWYRCCTTDKHGINLRPDLTAVCLHSSSHSF